MGKLLMWKRNRSDTNQAVQAQNMARAWKFRSQEEEALYYPSSENEGADQLCNYYTDDIRFSCKRTSGVCFSIISILIIIDADCFMQRFMQKKSETVSWFS